MTSHDASQPGARCRRSPWLVARIGFCQLSDVRAPASFALLLGDSPARKYTREHGEPRRRGKCHARRSCQDVSLAPVISVSPSHRGYSVLLFINFLLELELDGHCCCYSRVRRILCAKCIFSIVLFNPASRKSLDFRYFSKRDSN